MSCIICTHEYSLEKLPMTFPCTHTICSFCVNIIARENDSVFKCPICRVPYSISLGRINHQLLNPRYDDLDFQYSNINDQIEFLKGSKRIIREKIDELRRAKSASLPGGRSVLEQELDDEFAKIIEECNNQYKRYKKEYLRLKEKEYYDMDRQYTNLAQSICKRKQYLVRIQTLGLEVTEAKKKKFFDLSFPEPFNFHKYEIKFEKHNSTLSDKIKDVFWKVKRTMFTNLDMEHLAEEPYKRFKPFDYSSDHTSSTTAWTGLYLDAPL